MTGQSTTLSMKKFIRAQRSRVFQAWTDPQLLKLWFAPGDMQVVRASADARVGGTYLVEMGGTSTCTEPGQAHPVVTGTYEKVVRDELLVFSWGWQHAQAIDSRVTVEFRDQEGGTEVTLTHECLPDLESRDKHTHGWTGCLENLATRIGVPAPGKPAGAQAHASPR